MAAIVESRSAQQIKAVELNRETIDRINHYDSYDKDFVPNYTGTRMVDRGLGQILHDELHWLDVPDRVSFKLAVI